MNTTAYTTQAHGSPDQLQGLSDAALVATLATHNPPPTNPGRRPRPGPPAPAGRHPHSAARLQQPMSARPPRLPRFRSPAWLRRLCAALHLEARPMTRNQQMLELIRIHGPILMKDLAPIAERTHGISKTMTSFVLAQLSKQHQIKGRRIGKGNTQEYSLASSPAQAAQPTAQPKERGRAKPYAAPTGIRNGWPLADVPRNGGGPLFSGCADPATDAVIANLFEDDPDGQDLAEQVMQAIGKSAGLQTATQIRPHEVEAITFNTVLSKLVKAGCLGRGWIGDHAKGSYRYGKPGHPDLAELLPERPKAPTGDQVQSTVELAAGQGAAVRATDGVVTKPGHALPAIEPTPDRMATKLNQAPALTATKPADPATEPVTPCEVDSEAVSAVPVPDHLWPKVAIELDRIGELDDPIPSTPTGLLISGLLDLDDLIGDLCDRQAPHAAIRAAQTASASLRHGLVGLLTASGASS